jgi:hypothetical protein
MTTKKQNQKGPRQCTFGTHNLLCRVGDKLKSLICVIEHTESGNLDRNIWQVKIGCVLPIWPIFYPNITVFWLYWQQDSEWGFIVAGLLIKQIYTKPIRERAETIFLYGYWISIWYWRSFANFQARVFQGNDLRCPPPFLSINPIN